MGFGDQACSLGFRMRGDGGRESAGVDGIELVAERLKRRRLRGAGRKPVGHAARHLLGVIREAHGADGIAEIAVGQGFRGRLRSRFRRDQAGQKCGYSFSSVFVGLREGIELRHGCHGYIIRAAMNLWLQRILFLVLGLIAGWLLHWPSPANRFMPDAADNAVLDTRTGELCAPIKVDGSNLPYCPDLYKRY